MNIDLHFHHIPESYRDELRRENPWNETIQEIDGEEYIVSSGRKSPLMREIFDIDVTLKLMDERHIDLAAICPSPGLFHSYHPAEHVIPSHQRVNDHLSQLKRQYPDRFAPLGALPMQDPDAAITELERCMGELGLNGVEIETNVAGKNLDAPEFRPVFKRASELGAVIFMHPLMVLGPDRLRSWYLGNFIGNPSDTAVAVASLIFGGILEEFPELKIVCAHGGGSTPALIGRWVHGWEVRPETKQLPRSPMDYYRMLYFDSLSHSDKVRTHLIDIVGADRIVLGSDYPYDMGNERVAIEIEESSALNDQDRKLVLGDTAAGLLGL
ncbi:MAG: amidohydrolase family protein [Dehalococcoidia bacterium]|nr:amidohydrolase family protein [Dehalococcoidia bacterium]